MQTKPQWGTVSNPLDLENQSLRISNVSGHKKPELYTAKVSVIRYKHLGDQVGEAKGKDAWRCVRPLTHFTPGHMNHIEWHRYMW